MGSWLHLMNTVFLPSHHKDKIIFETQTSSLSNFRSSFVFKSLLWSWRSRSFPIAISRCAASNCSCWLVVKRDQVSIHTEKHLDCDRISLSNKPHTPWPCRRHSRFSLGVTAAKLVHRTIKEKVFWEFDSIIMQNVSDILPLFCTPTWPSHHVSENQE